MYTFQMYLRSACVVLLYWNIYVAPFIWENNVFAECSSVDVDAVFIYRETLEEKIFIKGIFTNSPNENDILFRHIHCK